MQQKVQEMENCLVIMRNANNTMQEIYDNHEASYRVAREERQAVQLFLKNERLAREQRIREGLQRDRARGYFDSKKMIRENIIEKAPRRASHIARNDHYETNNNQHDRSSCDPLVLGMVGLACINSMDNSSDTGSRYSSSDYSSSSSDSGSSSCSSDSSSSSYDSGSCDSGGSWD